MSALDPNTNVYFLFSKEQINEQNTVQNKLGKKFVPGTVNANGSRKKFTQLSTTRELSRFPDAVIVASGVLKDFVYEDPTVTKKHDV